MQRKRLQWVIGILFVLGFVACGMPMTRQALLYPTAPSTLYDQMILTLQDLGYTFEHTDKASLVILANKTRTSEQVLAALGGEKAKPYQVSVAMKEQSDKTLVSITITKPDEFLKSEIPKKLAKEIIDAFKKRVGEGKEIEVVK